MILNSLEKKMGILTYCPLFSFLKAVFHCTRFVRAGEATDFNLVKNQLGGHVKKVKVVQLPTVSARTIATKADIDRSY